MMSGFQQFHFEATLVELKANLAAHQWKQPGDEGHRSQLSPKRHCVVAAGLRYHKSKVDAGTPQ